MHVWLRSALVLLPASAASCASARLPAPRLPDGLPPDSVRTHEVAPGVRSQVMWHAWGPWVVHFIEVDLAACGVGMTTAKAGGRVIGREATSAMAAGAAARLGRPVLAAVNADFFSFDPPGRPEGAQVRAGEVVKSEPRRRDLRAGGTRPAPAFLLDVNERPAIEAARFEGWIRIREQRRALAGVNGGPPNGPILYNAFAGEVTPDSAALEWRIRRLQGVTAGDGAGVVVAVDREVAGVAVDAEHVAIAWPTSVGAIEAEVGDTIRWTLHFPPAEGAVAELIGGFPVLLRRGMAVHAEEYVMPASFAEQRHPRTAVGWGRDGRIVLLVVDGRQPGYSEGMTLAELADYAYALGLREVINLDGGGSTAMVVAGRIVNRPSDAAGERAVANALLVLGPRPGECAETARFP